MAAQMFCRVCKGPLKSVQATEVIMTCPECGTMNRLAFSEGQWSTKKASLDPETEIRQRADEFARIRNYRFRDLKEPIIQALVKKHQKYGDFYCPCKARTVLENVCPCKQTVSKALTQIGLPFTSIMEVKRIGTEMKHLEWRTDIRAREYAFSRR